MAEMSTLKADIDKGLSDIAEGRVKKFDAHRTGEETISRPLALRLRDAPFFLAEC